MISRAHASPIESKYLTKCWGNKMKIRTDNLKPEQQLVDAKRLLTGADCRLFRIHKYKQNYAVTHSWSERNFLGYLESRQEVTDVVPQPFKFFVGNRRYIPDCYFRENGRPVVVELKPKGTEFDHISIPVSQFLSKKGIEFRMVWNEDIEKHQQLAENWLYMARTLWNARDIETDVAEAAVLERLLDGEDRFGDFVYYGDRINTCETEIAIFRLAYLHKLKMDLNESILSNDTEILLCH